MLVLLIIVFSILAQNFGIGLSIAFICYFFINRSQSVDRSTHSLSNKSNKLPKSQYHIDINSTNDLIDMKMYKKQKVSSQKTDQIEKELKNEYSWYVGKQSDDLVSIDMYQEKISKKGSKIPPKKEAIYEKPQFYGKGKELKIGDYTISDPFIFYAESFVKEDELSYFTIYNKNSKKEYPNILEDIWVYNEYYYEQSFNKKQIAFLKWLTENRYTPYNRETQWCLKLYLSIIGYQISISPDDSLLDELLKLYQVNLNKDIEYNTILPCIVNLIEGICISNTELIESEKSRILEILVRNSPYDIIDGIPVLSESVEIDNLSPNTYQAIYRIAILFNYMNHKSSSCIAPILQQELESQGVYIKDYQLKKQSVFESYMYYILSNKHVNNLLMVSIQEIPNIGYYCRKKYKLPKLCITNEWIQIVKATIKDLKPYGKVYRQTNNGEVRIGQAERFLTLPFILKKHFGFSKKKQVDKIYKKTKHKIASPMEFVQDLGLECETITPKYLKQIIEVYYCMGYMVISDKDKLLIYQSEHNLESIFSHSSLLNALADFAINTIDNLSELQETRNTLLKYVQKSFELKEEYIEYLSYRLTFGKSANKIVNFYDQEKILDYLLFIIYIQQDFLVNQSKYKKIYQKFGQNWEAFSQQCQDNTKLKIHYNPIIINTVQTSNGSNTQKISLDFDKVKKLQESTQKSQAMLKEIFTIEDEDVYENIIEIESVSTAIDVDEIILKLISKTLWTQSELSEIFKSINFMINAGIEMINEYSNEQYGDILIFDIDSTYEINQDLKNEFFKEK